MVRCEGALVPFEAGSIQPSLAWMPRRRHRHRNRQVHRAGGLRLLLGLLRRVSLPAMAAQHDCSAFQWGMHVHLCWVHLAAVHAYVPN